MRTFRERSQGERSMGDRGPTLCIIGGIRGEALGSFQGGKTKGRMSGEEGEKARRLEGKTVASRLIRERKTNVG